MQPLTHVLDRFKEQRIVTADEIERFRSEVPNTQYTEGILTLARAGKIQPEVLADATYSAWLASENPKKTMTGGDWAELFRLAHQPDHEFFERPQMN